MNRCAPFLAVTILAAALPAQRRLEFRSRDLVLPGQTDTVALLVVDVDGDGRDELLVSNRQGARISLPCLNSYGLRFDPEHGVVPFFGWPEQPGGCSGPLDIQGSGDLDQDGVLEILSSSVVRADDGAGSWVGLPVGGAVAAADFDGDGLLDLVQRPLDRLLLRINQSALQFGDPIRLDRPVSYRDAVRTLDLDGDDRSELLLLQETALTAFHLSPDGQWAEIPVPGLPAVEEVLTIHVTDLDGDGAEDLYVVGRSGPDRILRNGGDGTLSEWVGALPVDANGRGGFAARDVDGDGDVDLAVAGPTNGILLRDGPLGFRWAAQRGWTPGPGTTTALALLDVDLDGHVDLVQGRGETLPSGLANLVFRGDGLGNFRPLDQDLYLPGAREAGDLDGDEFADLLVPDSGMWRNDRHGGFDWVTIPDLDRGGIVWATSLWDMDGDGDLDLARISSGGSISGLSIHENVGAPGYFVLRRVVDAFGLAITPYDWEGDGDLDLLIATPDSFPFQGTLDGLILNQGQGEFVRGPAPFPSPTRSRRVWALDANGDGHTDFASGEALFLGRAEGGFDLGPALPVGDAEDGVAAFADLDGDGFDDLVWGGTSRFDPEFEGAFNYVYWNDGAGHFTFDNRTKVGFVQKNNTEAVSLADFDQDGRIDLFFGNADLSYLQNDSSFNEGGRTFTEAEPGTHITADNDDVHHSLIADFDRDGDPDLYTDSGRVYWNHLRQLRAPRPAFLGEEFRLEVHGAGEGALLYLAADPGNLPLPPLGVVGLAPDSVRLARMLPAGAPVQDTRFPVPAVPDLAGVDVWLQALHLTPDPSGFRLSNVVRETLR